MRNLKKVLCLVLCLAMILSVAIVGAGAVFTDQKDVKNTEAVDMCVALNIIDGYEDNTFRPAGNITRAEMTKMICVVLNGGTAPTTSVSPTPIFSDVRNTIASWAEGYIEYCYGKGVVSGVGAGQFNPQGNVTATEAAKMLLVALGYNADVERYTGINWALYVNVAANQDGLYDGLENIETSAALSRDNAAQMIWNALQAYVINKESSIDRTDGSIVDSYIKSETTDLLDKMFAGDIAEGRMVSFTYNSTDRDWTYEIRKDGANDSIKVKSATNYTDLLGMDVKGVYDTSSSKAVKNCYGIFANESSVVLTSMIGDLPDLATGDTSFKVDGTKYKTDVAVQSLPVYFFQNGTYYNDNARTLLAYAQTNTANDAQEFAAVDDDNDGDIDFLMVTPFYVEKVTYTSATKFKTSALTGTVAGSFEFEDVATYDGLAKDDYVIHTDAMNSATDTDTFDKIDLISGKVVTESNPDIQIGSDWYTQDYSFINSTGYTAPKAGTQMDDVVVVNGYVFDADATGSTNISDYVVSVGGVETSFGVNSAKLLFSDNSKAVVTLASSSVIPTQGTMYTYSKNSDGEYILKNVSTSGTGYKVAAAGTNVSVAKASNSSDKAGYILDGATNSRCTIADDAVIFVNYEGSSYKVITGAAMKKVSAGDYVSYSKAYLLGSSSGSSYVVNMAYVSVSGDLNDADTYYGYITANRGTQNADDQNVRSLTMWNGTESTTLLTADTTTASGYALDAGNVIEYKVNADGEISVIVNEWDLSATNYTDATATTNGFGNIGIVDASGDTMTFKAATGMSVTSTTTTVTTNGNFFDLDSDTNYINIDTNEDVTSDAFGVAGTIALAGAADSETVADALIPNAFIVFDKDGSVALVVYDLNSDIMSK